MRREEKRREEKRREEKRREEEKRRGEKRRGEERRGEERREEYERVIGDVVETCQHEYCKRVEDIHKYINGYIHGQCGEV